MVTGGTPTLAVLAVVTIVGVVFTFDGYSLASTLLAWTGWIAGGVGGTAIGWFAATTAGGNPDRLVLAGGGLVIGAILGRILVPLISWLAVVLLGFLSTSSAVLTVLAGQQLANAISRLDTTVSSRRDVELLIDQLIALPVFQNQELMGFTLVGGLVGAILAAKFYSLLITTAVSVVGAALLAIAVPLWEPALTGQTTITESTLNNLSTGRFIFFLAAGLLVQGYRYSDELGLPSLSSSYDPLEGD